MATKKQPEWVDHSGEPLSKKLNFFEEPPPEIGEVLSAISSLPRDKEPWTASFRLSMAIVAIAIGGVLGVVIDIVAGVENWIWLIVWPVVGLLLGLLIGTALENFKHWVTYVGSEGIARFFHYGNPNKIQREILPFADAAHLRVNRTHYEDVIGKQAGREQSYTTYYFEWLDERGKSLMTISYKDHGMGEKKFRPEANHYHFGNAAEKAWTAFQLPHARKQIKSGEPVRFRQFPFLLNDWVDIGKEAIAFGTGKKTKDEWQSDEIAEVEIDRTKGVIRLRSVHAKKGWLSSKGIYQLPFADLGNAQLFLLLLHEFRGHPA